MRLLDNPLRGGQPVNAGESGAVGAGLLALLAEPAYHFWREQLGLNADSVVLLINTEGATISPTTSCSLVRQASSTGKVAERGSGC